MVGSKAGNVGAGRALFVRDAERDNQENSSQQMASCWETLCDGCEDHQERGPGVMFRRVRRCVSCDARIEFSANTGAQFGPSLYWRQA